MGCESVRNGTETSNPTRETDLLWVSCWQIPADTLRSIGSNCCFISMKGVKRILRYGSVVARLKNPTTKPNIKDQICVFLIFTHMNIQIWDHGLSVQDSLMYLWDTRIVTFPRTYREPTFPILMLPLLVLRDLWQWLIQTFSRYSIHLFSEHHFENFDPTQLPRQHVLKKTACKTFQMQIWQNWSAAVWEVNSSDITSLLNCITLNI